MVVIPGYVLKGQNVASPVFKWSEFVSRGIDIVVLDMPIFDATKYQYRKTSNEPYKRIDVLYGRTGKKTNFRKAATRSCNC